MLSGNPKIVPIDGRFGLKAKVYESLKCAIMNMNIYDEQADLRINETQLSDKLGVSRNSLREALSRLDQEGLVKIVPYRGTTIVRKTKAEILEMITVWAALESMAARLITEHATNQEISSLRILCSSFEREDNRPETCLDEYSDANILFHQAILAISRSELLNDMTQSMFMHLRAIRARTICEKDRAARSVVDHVHIIEALEARDTERAGRLVCEHNLNLKVHVERNVDID